MFLAFFDSVGKKKRYLAYFETPLAQLLLSAWNFRTSQVKRPLFSITVLSSKI